MHKKENGQFFTEVNPFALSPFQEWFALLPPNARLLEPFAGSNNLIKMITDVFGEYTWGSFDIEPPARNSFPQVSTLQRDTIQNMPTGFDAIITNPPYLARNSATRSGIKFSPDNKYDDLYKFCLEKMLAKYDFVAAIIPESFMTCGQFREKLFSVISLTKNMFSDTDCPVCIAMFVPLSLKRKTLSQNDFSIYRLNEKLGLCSEIETIYRQLQSSVPRQISCRFNDKSGVIGLRGVDDSRSASIRFVRGEEINPDLIKVTSRAITRISTNVDLSAGEIDAVILRANEILNDFRLSTNDIFMTSFKGLRKDGRYRRRLDFKKAGEILSLAISAVV